MCFAHADRCQPDGPRRKMMKVEVRRRLLGVLAVAGPVLLAGCDQNQYIPPPPPKVTVMNPVQQQVTRYFETTGNSVAINSAPLVARVQGYLQEVQYKDGAYVKKG